MRIPNFVEQRLARHLRSCSLKPKRHYTEKSHGLDKVSLRLVKSPATPRRSPFSFAKGSGGHPLSSKALPLGLLRSRVKLALPRKTCYHHALEHRAVERTTNCGVESAVAGQLSSL